MSYINAETILSIIDAIQDAYDSTATDIVNCTDDNYAHGYTEGAAAAATTIYRAVKKEADKEE